MLQGYTLRAREVKLLRRPNHNPNPNPNRHPNPNPNSHPDPNPNPNPTQVKLLRRILKDLVTLVPFVVILIIPLSPLGHVLVFTFIQRFFPDFFPSCYTERRQNLVKLYASAELDRLPERKKPGADRIFKL